MIKFVNNFEKKSIILKQASKHLKERLGDSFLSQFEVYFLELFFYYAAKENMLIVAKSGQKFLGLSLTLKNYNQFLIIVLQNKFLLLLFIKNLFFNFKLIYQFSKLEKVYKTAFPEMHIIFTIKNNNIPNLGKTLLSKMEKQLKKEGYSKLNVKTLKENNTKIIEFYKKLNYEVNKKIISSKFVYFQKKLY